MQNMKIKPNLISLAVGSALAAMTVGAQAGTLLPSAVGGNDVLATQMFGTGSEATLFQVAPVTMTLQVLGVATPDIVEQAATQTGLTTIKFTLSGNAVFGETVATPAAMAPFLNAVVVGGTNDLGPVGGGHAIEFDVIAGGAIGDNTVTVAFADVLLSGANTIQSISFGGFKVKNLTDQLATAGGLVTMAVEWRNNEPAGLVALDTATPARIFGSASATTLTGTSAALPRINVGDNETLFTATIPGDNDFTSPGAATVTLGTLTLGLVAGVMKEGIVPFDFNAGDAHTLVLTGTGTAPFAPYTGAGGSVWLANNLSGCTVPASSGIAGGTATVNPAMDTATFNLVGSTGQLTTTYEVCLTANGVTQIPETTVSGTWAIDYFNVRYVNDLLGPYAFNALRRNGCKVTLFNVPASNNASDDAFIRLTNTSTTVTGAVRASVWGQDGTALLTNADLVASVAPHATVVITPEAGLAGTTSLDTVMNTEWSGRSRVVLTGAFPSCEALGLIRNQTTGILTNMTATTQANSDSHAVDTTAAIPLTTVQPGNSGN